MLQSFAYKSWRCFGGVSKLAVLAVLCGAGDGIYKHPVMAIRGSNVNTLLNTTKRSNLLHTKGYYFQKNERTFDYTYLIAKKVMSVSYINTTHMIKSFDRHHIQ